MRPSAHIARVFEARVCEDVGRFIGAAGCEGWGVEIEIEIGVGGGGEGVEGGCV
jgi:hypothetical protein